MASTSGTVSGPFNVDYLAELIDTGDGAETSFSGTLSNVPVIISECTLNYTISATEYNIDSDSSGNFTGTGISSASVAENGTVTLSFSTAPDDTTEITLDYRAKGLLQVVLDFVTDDSMTDGQDWTNELQELSQDDDLVSPSDAYSGELLQQLVLSNTGESDAESIVVGLREFYRAASGEYGINLNGYRDGHDGAQSWIYNGGQHGLTGYDGTSKRFEDLPAAVFRSGSLGYWIFSNKNRILVVVKSSTVYDFFYVGYGHRLGPSSNYATPLFIGGSAAGDSKYDDTGNERKAFFDFYTGGSGIVQAFAVDMDGSYITQSDDRLRVVPQHYWDDLEDIAAVGDTDSTSNVLLAPVAVINEDESVTLMTLDGVFALVSDSVSAESVVTIGGDDYIVFPNVHRSTKFSYIAIKDE